MYYYIFEPPSGPNEYQLTAQIKEKLTSLGIAGEMTTPMPGRDIAALVENAFSKRYTTIVAVGGSTLINQVASLLVGHDAAFGIIPTHDHPDLTALTGLKNWEDACDQLKRRRWRHTRLGTLNGQICFLTPASCELAAEDTLTIVTPDYELHDKGPGYLVITPLPAEDNEESPLKIEIIHAQAKKRGFLANLFTEESTKEENTRIFIKQAQINLVGSAKSLQVAGQTIGEVPGMISSKEHSLRLIVARGGAQS